MGACLSSVGGLSEEEKAKHREAERHLRDAKTKLDHQVKVCSPVMIAFLDYSKHFLPKGSLAWFRRLGEVDHPQSELDSLYFCVDSSSLCNLGGASWPATLVAWSAVSSSRWMGLSGFPSSMIEAQARHAEQMAEVPATEAFEV